MELDIIYSLFICHVALLHQGTILTFTTPICKISVKSFSKKIKFQAKFHEATELTWNNRLLGIRLYILFVLTGDLTLSFVLFCGDLPSLFPPLESLFPILSHGLLFLTPVTNVASDSLFLTTSNVAPLPSTLSHDPLLFYSQRLWVSETIAWLFLWYQ